MSTISDVLTQPKLHHALHLQPQRPPPMNAPGSDEARFLAYVRSHQAGDLEPLLADHLAAAYRLARRLLPSDADAQDAVQEACIQLIRTAHRYDGSVPFIAWFGRLVASAGSAQARSQRRRRQRERAGQLGPAAEPLAQEEDSAERVRALVAQLPERYRRPLALHYFAGLDQRETAAALGLSVPALAMRLSRGRERLRAALQRTLGSQNAARTLPSTEIAALLAATPQLALPAALLPRLHAAVRASMRQSPRWWPAHPLTAAGMLAGLAIMAVIGVSLALEAVRASGPAHGRGPSPLPLRTQVVGAEEPPLPPPAPPAAAPHPFQALLLPEDAVGAPVFSPDGQHLAVRRDALAAHVAVIDVDAELAAGHDLPGRDDSGIFTQDGHHLVADAGGTWSRADGPTWAQAPVASTMTACLQRDGYTWSIPAAATLNGTCGQPPLRVQPIVHGQQQDPDISAQLLRFAIRIGSNTSLPGVHVLPQGTRWSRRHDRILTTLADGADAGSLAALSDQGGPQLLVRLADVVAAVGKPLERLELVAERSDGSLLITGVRPYPESMKNMMGTYVPGGDEAAPHGSNFGDAEPGPAMPQYLCAVAAGPHGRITVLHLISLARWCDCCLVLPDPQGLGISTCSLVHGIDGDHCATHLWLGRIAADGSFSEHDLGDPFHTEPVPAERITAPVQAVGLEVAPSGAALLLIARSVPQAANLYRSVADIAFSLWRCDAKHGSLTRLGGEVLPATRMHLNQFLENDLAWDGQAGCLAITLSAQLSQGVPQGTLLLRPGPW